MSEVTAYLLVSHSATILSDTTKIIANLFWSDNMPQNDTSLSS
ncbi:hypothetical protein FOQG_19522 [Fusarium oxysporum f. sp. raphani 54005]|uniref:Uncharacterized protein n=2 Tax=Fusarium oxysporum TaxID=5507 RepID=W9HAL4_FUSOX|nr:hypothetical protein FOYG_17536 [Fusarium oxysporum NRRL 32931]EXK75712.1 hypothetical protein FOQG_19522 [Fusarium oxysporum f. sp. raphani 54005]